MTSSGTIRAGRAFVELFADNTKLQQGLRVAEAQLKEFGAKTATMGRQIATLGGIAALPGAISTKIFAGFDDQMRAVQAVTGSTGEAFDQLTEKAKFLGRTTSFTAAQVASGMLELGRAGFKSDEIDAAISHVMDLARSTQTEIPRATEIAGNALRGFGLDADQMARVTDVLTTTANNSAQTLDDLGEAFKYVAPIADTAGMSLEETAKVLGTLANFGIKGSLAGTAVKNILTRMADPAVQAVYDELGVSVKDAEGNLRNMADVLREVGEATADMPNAERLAKFKELFDMRALAGGAKLSAETFQSLCDAIDNASGESQRVAQQMDAGIGGAFRMFLSAAEGMAIAVGTALAPEIKRLSDYLTEQQTAFTGWLNGHKEAIVSCTKLAAKAIALGAGLYVIGKAASAVGIAIGMFRSSLVAVRTVVAILTTDLKKIGTLFTNLGGLFKPIESVNASVDPKSAGTVQTLGVSAQSAAASVAKLNAALNLMRTAAASAAQAVTSLLTPLSQLLSLLRPLGTQATQNARAIGLFSKSLTPLAKSLNTASVAANTLARSSLALSRSYAGMETRISVNTASLRENQTAAKLAAVSIRSTRTAALSAAKGYAVYTKAVQENTAAITQNAQAGGVAPNVILANTTAIEAETAALTQNDAAQTANAASTTESASAKTIETASVTAETAALETNTVATTAQSAALGSAAEATTVYATAQGDAAMSSSVLTAALDSATVSTAAEAAATGVAADTASVNAAAQGTEATSYGLSSAAADANTVSVVGNSAATKAHSLSVVTDTKTLAGNTVSLEGNAAALSQNTTATLTNDAAVKTLAADSVAATGVFTRLGTAIKTTFATKTGGFLALSNKEAFTATANGMSKAWSSASATVVSCFGAIRGAATSTLTGIGSLFTRTATAIQTFSIASTVAAGRTVALTAVQKTCAAVTGLSRAVYTSAAAALSVFSAANIASAASVVKVTTVSTAAKGAVAAYGVAATLCAGATKALSAAMALICAHPVAAALTALGAVIAGLCIYLKDAGKYTAQLTDRMTELAEAGNKNRSLDQTKMEGVGKLDAKSATASLNDQEFAQGKKWVEELTSRYGDLGIQVDEVNKKIILATGSQKKFLAAMNAQALNDKDAVIAEEEKNLAELKKEEDAMFERTQGFGGFMRMEGRGIGQALTFGYVDSAAEAWEKQLEEQGNKISEQSKKLAQLRKERSMLAGGDETIATGGSIEESVQNSVAGIDADATPFNLNEFETRLRGTDSARDEQAKLQADYQRASAEIKSAIESAKTPEEKEAAQTRLANLDRMFTSKMAELTAALPENKAQTDFWDKINEGNQSEEDKEIAQLNKDLTSVLEAIRTEIDNAALNTKEGETPTVNVSAAEIKSAYQPEMAEATSHSEKAKTLVDKVTAGEYQNPEEFKSDSNAVISELGKTLDTMDVGPEREKLATAIDALKKFCEQVALTVGADNGTAPIESAAGAQIKEQAARNATDAQIQSVRDKHQKERDQKLQETQLAPEEVALSTAAQDRDEKRRAFETAKASGDKKAIRRSQVDYDRASQTYERAERAKNQTDLDTSAQEMASALADYDSAGEETQKREDAKRRYESAKSKNDTARGYFAENGTQEAELDFNRRETQTNLAEKELALQEAYESKDKTKIAAAQKDYDTARQEAGSAQTRQNVYTATQTADQTLETAVADRQQKQLELEQAQLSGDPEMIEQAQSQYDESDYAAKQAEYKKALAEAQNANYELSDAQKNYENVMKNGTPEEKKEAKERLKEAQSKQKDALGRLSSFDTGKAIEQASPDDSRPRHDKSESEQNKTEVKNASTGTFNAFEVLGQSYDWQRTNGERQLSTLTDIKSLLEDRDNTYI